MKHPLLLALILFTLPAMAQTSALLSRAQKAYLAGDVATAKPLFEQVLAQDPKNVAATNYLRAIREAEKQAGPEKQYQTLVLPKVEFQNASLESALQALKQQATKASGGKSAPNFVIQPGVDKETPVTLSLTDMPFLEVVRYVAAQAKAEVQMDRYAIILKPKAPKVQ